jgi:uncharacterized protein YjbI with pentapeptide repeats
VLLLALGAARAVLRTAGKGVTMGPGASDDVGVKGASRAPGRVVQSVAAAATRSAHSKARWVLLVAAVVGVIAGLVILAVGVVPPRLVGPLRTAGLSDTDRLKAEADYLKAINDVRSTLVAALGGGLVFTGALIGAVLTSRTIQVNRESNEISRKGQEAALEITRQGQITDRFTRAIDQLGQHGQDKLDVRLGGIYALERIARESAEDHGPIMEVLTAYLREHARVQPARAVRGPLQPEEQARSTDADEPPRLPADVQAIATVLGRRPEERRRQEQRPLDLREVDLRVADLTGAHLEMARLRDAHLDKANLIGVRMEGTDLRGAHLEKAAFRYAHLEGANLLGAHLEAADLRHANLKGADLVDAHLEGADLVDAHLEGADLADAHLEGANFRRAHLEQAILRGAHLEKAALFEAHLEGADLRNAHLVEGTYLGGAHLEGADLGGADLEGADLRGAHLEGAWLGNAHLKGADLADAHLEGTRLGATRGLLPEQLDSAITDGTTILPTFADEALRPTTSDPPS